MLLRHLFEDAPSDTYKLIWTLRDKRSHWFKNYEKMKVFTTSAQTQDLYFGLGITHSKLSQYKRARANQITGIKCVYLDIDFQDPKNHKKEGLPENIEVAKDIAYSVIKPTYLVNSGHGLHAYYLFDEWFNMQSNKDKNRGAQVVFDFQETVRQKNSQYSMDSVHDLSRVLRVPGSMNCKDPDNPVLCEIIEENQDQIYTIEEIEDIISYADTATTTARKKKKQKVTHDLFAETGDIKLDAKAVINPETFKALKDIFDPDFFQCWENKKNITDKSASGYDFALASYAYQGGLSDQETVNLLIHHRRTRGHDLKFNNPKYYETTLTNIKLSNPEPHPHPKPEYQYLENASVSNETFARLCSTYPGFLDLFNDSAEIKDTSPEGYDKALTELCVNDEMLPQEIVDLLIYHRRQRNHDIKIDDTDYYEDLLNSALREKRLVNLQQNPTAKPSADEKEQIREKIFDMTGMNIKNIYRYRYDPDPIFFVELETGKRYKLGSFKTGMADQQEFVAKYTSHTLSNIKAISNKKWKYSVLGYLLKLTMDKAIPTDATYKGRARTWPQKYFEAKSICVNVEECLEMGGSMPFWHKGQIYFSLKNMTKWLNNNDMDTRNSDFEISLLQNDFKIKSVQNNKRHHKFWCAPKGYFEAD